MSAQGPPPLPDEEQLAETYETEMKASPGWRKGRIGAPAGAAVAGGVIGYVVARGPGLLAVPVGAAIGYGVWAFALSRSAAGKAREVVLAAWMKGRGMAPVSQSPPCDDTPLLRDGYRREFGEGYSGPIAGRAGSVFAYTYVTRETRTRTVTDGQGHTRTETYQVDVDHDFTVARVALPHPGLSLLMLTRRSVHLHFMDGIESALQSTRIVDLESAEFADGFKLVVADDADDLLVRRLFTPATIVWCIEQGARLPAIQLENGVFVAYRNGHTDDPDELEALVAGSEGAIAKFDPVFNPPA